MAKIDPTDCKVAEPPEGVGANAFRVLPSPDGDCYLDFMAYCPTRDEAVVVARVQVSQNFLPDIQEYLAEMVEAGSIIDYLPPMDPLVN